jgi:hypothetical protein
VHTSIHLYRHTGINGVGMPKSIIVEEEQANEINLEVGEDDDD